LFYFKKIYLENTNLTHYTLYDPVITLEIKTAK